MGQLDPVAQPVPFSHKRHASAGAAYQWTTLYFGKFLGFFSGWALLLASMVFMVTGSLPLATSTLDFFDPALASNVVLSAAVASMWFLAVAVVLIVGIEVTSRVQMVMTSVELVILTIVAVAAIWHAAQVKGGRNGEARIGHLSGERR